VPFQHKQLAFRALQHGLRHAYDNWRMWANYMVVAVSVGELAEAARSSASRPAEERAAKDGAACVDLGVLDRLVAAAVRPDEDGEAPGPNRGPALRRRVLDLLERVLLPRLAGEPRLFRARARLLLASGRTEDALAAHADAYRCGLAAAVGADEADAGRWRDAAAEIVEFVDVLRNYGPKVEGSRWRAQARSALRTFMGRTRATFADEPEWMGLEELAEELKNEE
jgi:hypothetical protein